MTGTSTYDSKHKLLAHELIAELFSGAELNDLCAVYFPEVFALFTPEMPRVTKIRILVESCAGRKGGMSKLVNTIKHLKPKDYDHFAANAEKDTRPSRLPQTRAQSYALTIQATGPHTAQHRADPARQ